MYGEIVNNYLSEICKNEILFSQLLTESLEKSDDVKCQGDEGQCLLRGLIFYQEISVRECLHLKGSEKPWVQWPHLWALTSPWCGGVRGLPWRCLRLTKGAHSSLTARASCHQQEGESCGQNVRKLMYKSALPARMSKHRPERSRVVSRQSGHGDWHCLAELPPLPRPSTACFLGGVQGGSRQHP